MMVEIESKIFPITADNLPEAPLWEDDGCCWRAVRENPVTAGCDWRWQPQNWKAFAKGEPDSEMHDTVFPVREGLFKA